MKLKNHFSREIFHSFVFRKEYVLVMTKVAVAVIPLIFIPLYTSAIGLSGYAVFAYAILIQSMFNLFNFGFSPALTRALAVEPSLNVQRSLYSITEKLYCSYGVILVVISLLVSIQFELAPDFITKTDLYFIAMFLIASWPLSLVSGGLIGKDLQIKLNVIVLIATIARFVLGYYFINEFKIDARGLIFTHSFIFFIQSLVLRSVLIRSLPKKFNRGTIGMMRAYVRYGCLTAMVVFFGALYSQLDRQYAANFLTSEKFASYVIILAIVIGFVNLAAPISITYYPRMVKAFNEGDAISLRKFTKKSLESLCFVLFVPVISMLPLFEIILGLILGSSYTIQNLNLMVTLVYSVPVLALVNFIIFYFTVVNRVGFNIAIYVVGILNLACILFLSTQIMQSGNVDSLFIARSWFYSNLVMLITGMTVMAFVGFKWLAWSIIKLISLCAAMLLTANLVLGLYETFLVPRAFLTVLLLLLFYPAVFFLSLTNDGRENYA